MTGDEALTELRRGPVGVPGPVLMRAVELEMRKGEGK